MPMPKKDKEIYDAIIIGAGIGGLVCGCYLAKAGHRVLIVEKHSKPGGYCTSFDRKGYKFDVGVHYIGGVKRGVLAKILDELAIQEEIKFNQSDPSDKIILPDSTTYIRANPYDTIEEFQKTFPSEKENIEKFFEFVLDPGYYPVGGMQQFATCLVDKFKKYGGEIILSHKVINIITENNIATGIVIAPKEKIMSKIVVSNVDATQTFKDLIELETRESNTVDN